MGFDRGDIVTQCGWMGKKWEIEPTILQYVYHGCVWPWAFPVQASPAKVHSKTQKDKPLDGFLGGLAPNHLKTQRGIEKWIVSTITLW